MEKQNRAERRRNKFGGGRATDHGGWPTHQPNPVFHAEVPAGESPPAAPHDPAQPVAESATEASDEADRGSSPPKSGTTDRAGI